MKNLLLLIFLCSLSFYSNAQQQKLDSLIAVANANPKNDSLKVRQIINIIRQQARMKKFDEMERNSVKALGIAQKLNNAELMISIYERMGLIYHGNAMYRRALEFYQKGLAAATSYNKKGRGADMYLDMGALYSSIPDYPKALEANQRAVDIYNELNDKENLSNCYMNIGVIYDEMKQEDKSIEYVSKALAAFKEQNGASDYGVALAYGSLANSYLTATDAQLRTAGIDPAAKRTLALDHLNKALYTTQHSEAAAPYEGAIYRSLGNFYETAGDNNTALSNYLHGLDLSKKEDDKEELISILLKLGDLYRKLNETEKSKGFFMEALALSEETGIKDDEQAAAKKLSVLYERKGMPDSALFYFKKHVAINDLLITEAKEKDIVRKQLQLDFSIKENDYRLTQAASDYDLKQQKKAKLYLIIGIALLFGIAGFIFYNQRKTAKLNRIINEQKRSLEQLSEVKDKIFSVVSHDMRAPVNSLISFIDILEGGNLKQEKLAMYAGELKTNLAHTSTLMNNLLLWASSQMKGFRTTSETVLLNEAAQQMINSIRHHQEQKNVTIINTIPDELVVKADKNMLAVLLRNITGNAIKFSFPGGKIVIDAHREATGVVIGIKDEGTGMDPETVRIFNSDDAVISESKRGTGNEKGTGLGLLLCKTFAAQMNGTITARKDEQGMTFIITLPA